jgi:molecular chaperone GrpE (heat shock protein)
VNSINSEEQNENGISPEFKEEETQNISGQEDNENEQVDDVSSDIEAKEENKDSYDSTGLSFDEVLLERDEYLNLLQSVKAEFDNYQKQTKKRITETAS